LGKDEEGDFDQTRELTELPGFKPRAIHKDGAIHYFCPLWQKQLAKLP
jgi:hypothetical protein